MASLPLYVRCVRLWVLWYVLLSIRRRVTVLALTLVTRVRLILLRVLVIVPFFASSLRMWLVATFLEVYLRGTCTLRFSYPALASIVRLDVNTTRNISGMTL